MTKTQSLAGAPSICTQDNPCELEIWYPRIIGELTARWCQHDIDAYLRQLILDERHGRRGFPPEIMEELLLLAGIRWQLNPPPLGPADVDWVICARRWP